MSDLISMITSQLGGGAVDRIAGRIGADRSTTQGAIGAAVPLLVTALAKNAATPEGAKSLDKAIEKDHDGGLLDNLSGFLGNPAVANGAGILEHMLGGKKESVAGGLSKGTGLSAGQSTQLLAILAPIVMAALGKTKKSQGFDVGGLASMLAGEKQAAARQGGGLLGGLAGMLDADGDGSAIDDIGKMAGKFFGK